MNYSNILLNHLILRDIKGYVQSHVSNNRATIKIQFFWFPREKAAAFPQNSVNSLTRPESTVPWDGLYDWVIKE